MSEIDTSKRIFEAALSGRTQDDEPAPPVIEFVEALREEKGLLGVPRDAEAQIAAAASAVPEVAATAPGGSRRAGTRLRRRVLVLAASMALMAATAGVGLANNAIPTQALYGLDMALEKVGIGDGGASERAAEVLELLNQGQTGLALGHAAATISSLPEPATSNAEAQAALEAVAEKFAEEGSPLPEGVSDLIATLAESIGTGDGETISQVAMAIRDSIEAGEGQGPPDDLPGGPPSSVPAPPVTIPTPPPNPSG